MTGILGLHYRRHPFPHRRGRHGSSRLRQLPSHTASRFVGGLNRYAFCGGDPINNTDPDGLVPRKLEPQELVRLNRVLNMMDSSKGTYSQQVVQQIKLLIKKNRLFVDPELADKGYGAETVMSGAAPINLGKRLTEEMDYVDEVFVAKELGHEVKHRLNYFKEVKRGKKEESSAYKAGRTVLNELEAVENDEAKLRDIRQVRQIDLTELEPRGLKEYDKK